jgi:hypothetical protein
MTTDPKEAKRQRNREYYAKNKDEIAKRRRQARELKKQVPSTDANINDNTVCHTPDPPQSGVSQLQYKTPGHVFFTRAYMWHIFLMQILNYHLQ